MAITPSDYSRQVEITGASAPASTLTGYVALITEANLPSEIWSTALNGGGDLRVCTDSAGTDQLPLEVVSFDTVAETAVLWVRFASYSSAARALWLFYGKTGDSQPAPSSTYGSQSVWQDDELVIHQGTSDDATGNHTPTLTGSPSLVSMMWGGQGYDLGTTANVNYITIPHSTDLSLEKDYYVDMWRKGTGEGASASLLVEKADSGNSNGFRFLGFPHPELRVRQPNLSSANLNNTNSITTNAPQKLTAIFDGTTRRLYVDNTVTTDTPTGTVTNNTEDMYIGRDNGASNTPFDGVLGTVRIRKQSISTDLRDEEYDNQSNPATFWTTGTPQDTSPNPSHTRKVDVTGTNAPASTLTGYVALITEANLPTEIWTTALNGGGDLQAYTDSAKTTRIPLEVVGFDTIAQTAQLWVRFPTYSTSDRTVWLFYGKAGESQPAPSSTYGSQSVWQDFAHFVGCYDLSPYDATGNSSPTLEGTGFTASSLANGLPVIDFDGVNTDCISLGDTGSMSTGDFMLSCVVNLDTTSGFRSLIARRDGATKGFQWRNNSSTPSLLLDSPVDSSSSISAGVDLWLAVKKQGSTIYFYQNGVQTDSAASTSATDVSVNTTIGGQFSGLHAIDGRIGYSGIRTVIPTDDLMSEEYDNQSNPATFWTTGTPQDTSGGGATYSLTLDAGSYVYTGSAVDLIAGRKLSITPGSYAYTGSATDLIAGRKLSITPGSYAYTGSATDLIAGRKLTIDPASYTYTGNDVTLTYTPTGGATYSLTLDAGSYALTGSSVDLLVNRKLSLDAGSFSYTGSAVNLIVGRKLTITAGSYAVNGQAVDLKAGRKLSIDAGAYNYSGLPVTLSYSGVVISLISGYSVQYRQDDISINFNSDNIQAEFT